MKKMIFFCAICFSMLFTNAYAIECEIVMDADSGRVLYGKNEHEKKLIASTTKIMTSLVVLNNVRLKDEVIVGDEVLDAYGSSIYIKPKEKLTVEDLLYGLILRSGNDAAMSLAVYTAGSMEAFASLMNETASSIGMNDTIFENSHGLDDETKNYSTAYDMALLMRESMKSKKFRQIAQTKKYSLKTNFNTYEWINKNKLLNNYKYATGGKTGYTTLARHTFVSSATKDEKNLIIVTFVDADRFNTHKKLYEKYFEKYEKYILIDKNRLNIDYKKGYKLFTTESFSMLLRKDEIDKVNREIVLYKNIEVDDKASVVGTISISLDGKVYKKLNIYAENNKNKKGLWSLIKELFKW